MGPLYDRTRIRHFKICMHEKIDNIDEIELAIVSIKSIDITHHQSGMPVLQWVIREMAEVFHFETKIRFRALEIEKFFTISQKCMLYSSRVVIFPLR